MWLTMTRGEDVVCRHSPCSKEPFIIRGWQGDITVVPESVMLVTNSVPKWPPHWTRFSVQHFPQCYIDQNSCSLRNAFNKAMITKPVHYPKYQQGSTFKATFFILTAWSLGWNWISITDIPCNLISRVPNCIRQNSLQFLFHYIFTWFKDFELL